MKTYKEGSDFYAVIWMSKIQGHYYLGPFKSRSTARRRAIKTMVEADPE